MKVTVKGHTTVIRNTADTAVVFCDKISHELGNFRAQNLILDLTHGPVTLTDINGYLLLSKAHKKEKKSFVIVAQDMDYNAIPNSLHVVPSLQEAHDIIEMEEIERDLGF